MPLWFILYILIARRNYNARVSPASSSAMSEVLDSAQSKLSGQLLLNVAAWARLRRDDCLLVCA